MKKTNKQNSSYSKTRCSEQTEVLTNREFRDRSEKIASREKDLTGEKSR